VKRFQGIVEARGNGHFVRVPFDTREVFGKVRAPLRVSVKGHEFRTTAMRYDGVDMIGLNHSVRASAGLSPGDSAEFAVQLDLPPRVVEVPPELRAVLESDSAAWAAFKGLSYTHQNEYARWISEAKRVETRARRAARAIEMLLEGLKTPA
jgi:hypothetical protein